MKKFLSLLIWLLCSLCLWIGTFTYWQAKVDDGVSFSGDCLRGMWSNCFNYEKVIGIDKQQWKNFTVKWIAQDAIFSATYMVWTVLAFIIIWCGLWYIFKPSKSSEYKKWLISAAIGSLLVWWAYAIIRLIQYIAKWT